MTVAAAVITAHCTVHATDSFITTMKPNGFCDVVESQATKIVRVEAWRGALAYWGLATLDDGWSTLSWLRTQAASARKFASAEAFARGLADGLTAELSKRVFRRATDAGIGIHFTAYERIGGAWIPELFHVRNWKDTSYSALRPGGLIATRETYAILKNLPDRPDSHRDPAFRLEVRRALRDEAVMFYVNNGDPILFNPIANAMFGSFLELRRRKLLRDPTDVTTHLELTRRPVQVVSQLIAGLAKKGCRRIGGKPHELAVRPSGSYVSSTGD